VHSGVMSFRGLAY